jgi:hypothetical protein
LAYTLPAYKPVADVAATTQIISGRMVTVQQVIVQSGTNDRVIVFVQAGFVDKIIGNALAIGSRHTILSAQPVYPIG